LVIEHREAAMTLIHTEHTPQATQPAAALAAAFERLGTPMSFGKNEEVYGQDDEARRFYRVTRGVTRTSRVTADGRRQVGAFYYPGDVFGLDPGPLHRFAAEALTDCEVQIVGRNAVRAFAGDAEVERAILEETRREMERLEDHVMLLGRKGAVERVASFLMGLAQRRQGAPVDLAMGRQDMADYLGLTIETVSRTLTQLQGDAVVTFATTRRFQVRDWGELEALAA
jgi:CRP/FNR family nitrogen fixation transcriptional regulator